MADCLSIEGGSSANRIHRNADNTLPCLTIFLLLCWDLDLDSMTLIYLKLYIIIIIFIIQLLKRHVSVS